MSFMLLLFEIKQIWKIRFKCVFFLLPPSWLYCCSIISLSVSISLPPHPPDDRQQGRYIYTGGRGGRNQLPSPVQPQAGVAWRKPWPISPSQIGAYLSALSLAPAQSSQIDGTKASSAHTIPHRPCRREREGERAGKRRQETQTGGNCRLRDTRRVCVCFCFSLRSFSRRAVDEAGRGSSIPSQPGDRRRRAGSECAPLLQFVWLCFATFEHWNCTVSIMTLLGSEHSILIRSKFRSGK